MAHGIPGGAAMRMSVDVLIVGAGVAGLWLAARLRRRGFAVAVVTSGAAGQGQTIHSQGIIHGGLKYGLDGRMGRAPQALAAMPGRWLAAMAGDGELDLQGVRMHSPRQLLWSAAAMPARLARQLAQRMLHSAPLQGRRPPPFDGCDCPLVELAEPVLDVPSLIVRLLQLGGSVITTGDAKYQWRRRGQSMTALHTGEREIDFRALMLCAGAGNAGIIGELGEGRPKMQLRPLQMLLCRGLDAPLPELYGHCTGASPTPLATITSHGPPQQRSWYIGGQVAETGGDMDPAKHEEQGPALLARILPWWQPPRLQWRSIAISRAEPAPRPLAGRARNATVLPLAGLGNAWALWPLKLALAPQLADRALAALQQAGVHPAGGAEDAVASVAPVAKPPWQERQS